MKTYQDLWQSLTPLYDAGEAQAIVRMVLDVKYGMTLTDIIGGKVNELSSDEGKKLEEIFKRLQNAEPVQYVLGQADFMGMTFHVEPGVLIPRPETAELCQWIIDEEKKPLYFPLILDLCTGSGCIAITLNKNIRNSDVLGIDISEKAIEIAEQNAQQLEAPYCIFTYIDVLDLAKHIGIPRNGIEEDLDKLKGTFDVIVSNPPYICEKEKADMAKNVLEHEPSLALFVPDDDPLLFYRAIAKIGLSYLSELGHLYFEMNPLYADDIKQMLEDMGYIEVEIKEDSFGKKRMIRAKRDAD